MKLKKSVLVFIAITTAVSYFSFLYGRFSMNDLLYQDTHMVIDEVYVSSSLYRIHPFLAEYERKVGVQTPSGSWSFDVGIDSGGFADIHVYRNESSILIPTLYGIWNGTNIATGQPEIVRNIDKDLIYLGKFTFVEARGRQWRYVPAEKGIFEKPRILKGG